MDQQIHSGSKQSENRLSRQREASKSEDEEQLKTELKRSENRWVRPSEASKSGSEEELKTEELYRKVRSILNKLTPQKFQTLTQQIIDLDIDTAERLEGAIDLIFEKAIDESAFSVAYANMCRCLIPKKVVVKKDGAKKDITFRKILLNKCQKEFEKEKPIDEKIHEKLEDLTKQGLSEEELEIKKRELRDEEHIAKRRTLGNIRFIGELFKLKMLTEKNMHDCVVKLLKSSDEESFECLCKLLVTIGKDLDHPKAKPRVDQYFNQINKIIHARITSSRVRFMMQDIVDLRSNDWVPRREDNNPKTIDQIHKEAADQAKKTQMMIQMAKQDKKLSIGNMGGRDSPRPGSIPQADETWTTVASLRGPRNVSVDPKKFRNIKRPVDSVNISLGKSGTRYGAWARGSNGGTGAVGGGAGPSAATGASTAAAAETDNRPLNRYYNLAGESLSAILERKRRGVGQFPPGEREKALKAVRAVTQLKSDTQVRDGRWGSPRLTPKAALAAEATILGPAAAVLKQELSEEAVKKETLYIVDEYLNIRDVKEAAECLRELQSPSRYHVFVEVMLNHTMEKKVSDRHATGKLLHSLLRDGVLTDQQYLNGLEQIFECAEEIEIDYPHLWRYLGELMGPTAFDGNLNLDELFKCVLKYVSKRKAAKLFAYMLQSATSDTSQEDVAAILNRYNVTVIMFFDTEEEARKFAKDMNIEFALGRANSSTSQHSASIQEELRTIILKRKARNEDVFDWVDKNVPAADTKKSPFIRALVTVVCEGMMDKEVGGDCKCNVNKLKDRTNLLQKYIDDNTSLEVQALYAVQALFVELDHPPGFIKSYFDSLYDEGIISEESFYAWQTSPDEEPGKGVTVIAASEFFRWLKSAPEKNTEEIDESEDSVAEETTLSKTEEVLSDEETRNGKEVYLRHEDEDDFSASFVGGYPFNEPIKSEDNTTTMDLIRSLDYCKRQREMLEGTLQQSRTSQKESKAKEEDFKTKLQILEKKLRVKEQDNVILKKAHKEELEGIKQQLRTSQKESTAKEKDFKMKLQTLEKKLRDKEQGSVLLKKAHKEELEGIKQQLRISQKESKANENFKMKLQTLEKELRDQEQENVVLKKALSEANERIANFKSQLETRDWVISRDDIKETGPSLGCGGYGSVFQGRYCGCAVAIKKPHYFLSPRERKSFQREMDIASRCRHPCLLQFIGATNDEKNPLFVTELMENSLRRLLYEQSNEKLSDAEIAIICLDVARALNYLHQRKPTPIVHRDVSSANVLLWRRGKNWRGKLSDYGTARLVEEMMTRSPGAMIYSAPEASTSFQTVKVDVYSFGVLLCEMSIQESPDPDKRNEHVALMKNREFRDLVERCLEEDPDLRPDMDEVIKTLEQFDDTS